MGQAAAGNGIERGKVMIGNSDKLIPFECDNCGKPFLDLPRYDVEHNPKLQKCIATHFCSEICKDGYLARMNDYIVRRKKEELAKTGRTRLWSFDDRRFDDTVYDFIEQERLRMMKRR